MRNYRKTNGRLSDKDLDECLKRALANNRLEGLEPTKKEQIKIKTYAEGRMTIKELIQWGLRNEE